MTILTVNQNRSFQLDAVPGSDQLETETVGTVDIEIIRYPDAVIGDGYSDLFILQHNRDIK